MFFGRHYNSIDEKGRIKVPSSFKKSIGEIDEERILVLTNFGSCVRVFPKILWDKILDKSKEAPSLQENKLASDRFFFSSVVEAKMDKQGRLLIPNSLRKETGLNEEVVLLGIDYRFEIWDHTNWDDYQQSLKKDEIIKDLTTAGF